MQEHRKYEDDHKVPKSILAKVATTFATIDLDHDHVEITPHFRSDPEDGTCPTMHCTVALIQAIASFIRKLVLDRVRLNFFLERSQLS